jgi:hypothetical protein
MSASNRDLVRAMNRQIRRMDRAEVMCLESGSPYKSGNPLFDAYFEAAIEAEIRVLRCVDRGIVKRAFTDMGGDGL